MIRIFLKNQWKTPALLVLFLCMVLFVQDSIDSQYTERYQAFQTEYLNGSDLNDKQVFFSELEKDKQSTKDVVDSIENFEAYDGAVFLEEIDPVLIASGVADYANYDMIVWREGMLQMPGKYSKTVEDDYNMLSQLSSRLNNQQLFEINIENSIELAKRGMKRNDDQYYKYRAAYSELLKINSDFPVTDTAAIDKILNYFESDFYIVLLLVLSVFGIFSSAIQNRITNQIIISKMGIRRFVALEIFATVIISVLSFIVYYFGIVFVLSDGNLTEIPWNLPIQAVNGYENIPFAFSIWEYLLRYVLFKSLYCIMTVSIIMLISVLSKTAVISAIISSFYCGALIILFNINASSGNSSYSLLLLGNSKPLVSDLPFVSLGSHTFSYYTCSIAVVVLISVMLFIFTVFISKITTGRWVK